MKKIISLLSLMTLLPIVISTSALAEKNSSRGSFYEKFTPEDFKSYAPANRIIDFKNIDYPLLNAAIYFEIERIRTKNGKPSFLHSEALEKAAFLHSKDMAERNYLSHTNPFDPKRETPSQRMAMFGVKAGYIAENIALSFGIEYEEGSPLIPPRRSGEPFRDFKTGEAIRTHSYNSFAEAVADSWMNSKGHRANILDKRLKFIGAGAYLFKDSSFHQMDVFKVTLDLASDTPE